MINTTDHTDKSLNHQENGILSYITGCQTCCNTHAHCSHTMLSTMRFCRTAETASCGISLCSSAGRKNIERMLHVLFRRGNRARVESTWRRLQTNQRGLVHRSTERSNKMEDSTRTSLLFFRSTLSVCHVYLSSLEQQQGETVYPRSRSVNLLLHRTSILSIQGEVRKISKHGA